MVVNAPQSCAPGPVGTREEPRGVAQFQLAQFTADAINLSTPPELSDATHEEYRSYMHGQSSPHVDGFHPQVEKQRYDDMIQDGLCSGSNPQCQTLLAPICDILAICRELLAEALAKAVSTRHQ